MAILLDSNIIIYAAQPHYSYLRPLLVDSNNVVSRFSELEVLGYHGLSPVDRAFFNSAFAVLERKEITRHVIQQAISLRQIKKMSPGDAIIAATSLLFGLELYTRNVSDFSWITDIKITNPL